MIFGVNVLDTLVEGLPHMSEVQFEDGQGRVCILN
jgi:hypothetical protein